MGVEAHGPAEKLRRTGRRGPYVPVAQQIPKKTELKAASKIRIVKFILKKHEPQLTAG